MKKVHLILWVGIFLLAGCGKQAQTAVATSSPATATFAPTATSIPPTDTLVPLPTLDPTVFGVIGTNEIQGYVLESVVSAIFNKTLDEFVASGAVQEYQIISVTVFPGSSGLLAEVIYSVRTTDPAWLADGGIQLADGWISNGCSRFDFFTTETEYQLKNKRLCS